MKVGDEGHSYMVRERYCSLFIYGLTYKRRKGQAAKEVQKKERISLLKFKTTRR
jgi:ribosomal protein L37E